MTFCFKLLPDFNDVPSDDISLNNKFWYTCQNEITHLFGDYVKEKNYKHILEIGPSTTPIPFGTHTISLNKPESITNVCIDIDKMNIPIQDNFFDFGYARHVFEDIQNPEFAFNEVKRTCNEFYIETPSPLVELLKNVDNIDIADRYRGYIHHRYFVWSLENTLYFLPKYPIVEHLEINKRFENKLIYIAENYPISWNNYMMCNKDTKIIMLKNEFQFNFFPDSNSYTNLLVNGILQSMEHTNSFIPKLLNGIF